MLRGDICNRVQPDVRDLDVTSNDVKGCHAVRRQAESSSSFGPRVTGMSHRLSLTTILAHLVLIAVTWSSFYVGSRTGAWAEVIFHRRDHRDQGNYASDRRSTYNIHSYGEAADYLAKYGYLVDCSLTPNSAQPTASRPRRRRDITSTGRVGFSTGLRANEATVVVTSSESRNTPRCSDADIQRALRRLQRKFDLRPSGRLDEETRKLMSKGRCGNSDGGSGWQSTKAQRFLTASQGGSQGGAQGGGQSGSHGEVGNGGGALDGGRRQERRTGGNGRVESSVTRSSADVAQENDIRSPDVSSRIDIARNRSRSGRQRKRRSIESSVSISTGSSPTRSGSTGSVSTGSGSAGSSPTGSVSIGSISSVGTDALPSSLTSSSETRQSSRSVVIATDNIAHNLHSRVRDDAVHHRPQPIPGGASPGVSGGGLPLGGRAVAFTDSSPGAARRRRQQMLSDILASRRNATASMSTTPLVLPPRGGAVVKKRKRRTISVQSMGGVTEGVSGGDRTRFNKDENNPVQWCLLDDGISGKIPLIDQRAILELAFRMWSEVIPLKFNEANHVGLRDMDVIIAFAKQNHMNCDKPFDGHGGELAHSWRAGDIHFDEDENYKRDDPSGTGINLLKVAVHEIGHVLGLLHNERDSSIMYPIYVNPDMYDDFELSTDDRRAVQNIYGLCKGSFDVVFDWLRRVSAVDAPGGWRYVFNTYFFRENRYWMYENRFNRTRFGDPLHIERGWTGLQGPVDGFVQVITSSGSEFNIDTYFFRGALYYKYDDDRDQLVTGYPRRIAADFGPKAGSTETIPNDLDAVLFDNRDSLLYFFKGDWVWIYNPRDIGRNGCCEAKVSFTSLFPMADDLSDSPGTGNAVERLTGNVDAAFYSYHYNSVFFFKGESVFKNEAYAESQSPRVNRLRRLDSWYHVWHDICDVE